MPEFILEHGSCEATKSFRELDSFTQGYIEAMFFTNTGSGDDGDLENASVAELADDTLQEIVKDCVVFQVTNRADLDEALDNGRINGYDETRAGHDFWYTRNGHGCGYWDRDLGDVGDKLADICRKQWHAVDVYRGDDGLIYCS